MDFKENHYYDFVRICLSMTGLWPYTKSRTRIRRAFIVYLNMFCIFSLQIAKIITTKHKINILLDMMPDLITCISGIILYTNTLLNRSKIYEMFEFIKRDWQEKGDTKEFQIMRKYAEDSRKYSIIMIGLFYGCVILRTLISIIPLCMDFVSPLNETRPRKLPFQIEFFVNEEKYFCSILLISLVMASILGVSVLSNTNITLLFMQHIYGMFAVVGNMVDSVFNDKYCSETEAYAKVVCSIKYHKQALQFEEFVRTIYEHIYLMFGLIGLPLLSISFLQMIRIITIGLEHWMDFVTIVSIFIVSTTIVFLNCYFGQKLIDHSTFLFGKVFSVPWYLLTTKSQMLLWFMIMRSSKPCYMSLGKLFNMSIQFFASLLQTAISYAMVIYSLQ